MTKKDCIYIYLNEENNFLLGYISIDFDSKRFYEKTIVQDFPIRGKAVYLAIRRRRWRSKLVKLNIKNDYFFIAEGSKFTI